jgi:hypothetical protein
LARKWPDLVTPTTAWSRNLITPRSARHQGGSWFMLHSRGTLEPVRLEQMEHF